MTTFHVPTVDISSWVAGRDDPAAAAVLDRACRTVGFVQIVGHGVPASAIEGLKRAIDAFFLQPVSVEKESTVPPPINRGYTAPKSDSLSLGLELASRMNDFFEAFNVGAAISDYPQTPGLDPVAYAENFWPASTPGFDWDAFRAEVSTYFAAAAGVARVLTRMFAHALGVPTAHVQAMTAHSMDVVRMNHYALPPGTVDLDGDLTGRGEHTDFGLVTVLWADQIPGPQVLGEDGRWHDVSPADDALLVNLGDVTGRWTNENYRSTLHRVKPPIVDGTIERRRSAAFFHDGNIDALISATPSCIGGGALYQPITVGEHVAAKLAGSRTGVRNTAAQREAHRVRAAAR